MLKVKAKVQNENSKKQPDRDKDILYQPAHNHITWQEADKSRVHKATVPCGVVYWNVGSIKEYSCSAVCSAVW